MPPKPTNREPVKREPRGSLELAPDVRLQSLALAALGRPVAGEKALGHAYGAQSPGARLACESPGDAHELQRASAEVEHATVGEGGRVDCGQISITGLLLTAENAHVEACASADLFKKCMAVLGIADRARRDRIDGALAETALVTQGDEPCEGL